MNRAWMRFWPGLLAMVVLQTGFAQQTLTWPDVRAKFEASNPTLRAAQLAVDEARAQEISAFLRPNPSFTVSVDQIDPFTTNPYQPFVNALPFGSVSYLHERQHKRELRLESAKEGTGITASQSSDAARTLLFNLRMAFVQTLQQKAVLTLARENLTYYDRLLDVSKPATGTLFFAPSSTFLDNLT